MLEFSLEHAISALGPGLFFIWSLEMICITSDIILDSRSFTSRYMQHGVLQNEPHRPTPSSWTQAWALAHGVQLADLALVSHVLP